MDKHIETVEAMNLADLRQACASIEGKAYGARKAYALALLDILGEDFFKDERQKDQEVLAERKAYVEACALVGHPKGTTLENLNKDVRKVALRRGEANWSNVKKTARAEAETPEAERGTKEGRAPFGKAALKGIVTILKRGERDVSAKESKMSVEEQAFNVALFQFMTQNPAAVALYKLTPGKLESLIGVK